MAKIYVCMGKDCRKRALSRDTLDALRNTASVKIVGCQKVCKAPVVGVDRGEGPRWFKRVDTEKSQRGIVDYAVGAKLPKALSKRESSKRAGKLER